MITVKDIHCLEIFPYSSSKFCVLEDFEYPMKHRVIFVPKHFITDLSSIPRIFWNFYPPFGLYTLASIIHDFLYSKEGSKQVQSRKEADEIFLTIMEETGVSWYTRILFYYAVRLFGSLYFQKE
ncbi:hypothetical protein FSBG_01033 [Fusobacterium gonidiaformans 3-1-5R]|uniref:DUF1353 domain-containing protein n=2 Tax=Fusobacterium TaxID=848 RepID=E5BGB3_9FUSO|nr:hypothetical protein FSBG_01033 [Fusobacterium gonidiaformans 3-1-5R]